MQELNPIALERPKRRARRTHSRAFKANLVALAESGQLSVAQIAMDNKINANQLRKWMTDAQSMTADTKMLPVSVVQSASAPSTVVMELNINAYSVRLHHSWDPTAVAKLIKALR